MYIGGGILARLTHHHHSISQLGGGTAFVRRLAAAITFDKLNILPRFTAEVSSEDSILLILQFGSLPSCDVFLVLWICHIPQYYGGLLPDIFTV